MPLVIERYRSVTVTWGYERDSINNSLGDVVSFVVGYFIASKLGLWRSIALFLLVDLTMLVVTRHPRDQRADAAVADRCRAPLAGRRLTRLSSLSQPCVLLVLAYPRARLRISLAKTV